VRVYATGAYREVTGGRVRIGGVWRTLVRGRAYIGGAWRDIVSFVQPLTLVVSPTTVTRAITAIPGTAISPSVTATPSGGRAPFSYSWARVGMGSITVNSPASATTTFSRFFEAEGDFTELFRCSVTDSLGTVVTGDVTVRLLAADF
jgi:hypothetical protein